MPQVSDGVRPDPAEPTRPGREPSTRRRPKKFATGGVRRPIAETRKPAAKVRAQIARAIAELPVAPRTIKHAWAPPPFPFFLTRIPDEPPEDE